MLKVDMSIRIIVKQKDHSLTRLKNMKFPIKKQNTENSREFPGGSVVKNLPANAGDTGSILGPGGSHMLQSNEVCVPQLLSLCPRARAPPEKPLQ